MGEREHEALSRAYSVLELGNIPKGALLKSAPRLFHQVSFNLASAVEPSWPGNPQYRQLFQHCINENYRKKFCELIDSLHKNHPDLIKSCNKSWLVQAGGPRVVRCLLQLSTVALHLKVQRNPNSPTESEDIFKESCIRIDKLNAYTKKVDSVIVLYENSIEALDREVAKKEKLLQTIADSLTSSFPDRLDYVRDLLNLYEKPKVLNDWKLTIEDRITSLEKKQSFLTDKKSRFSRCAARTKTLIKRRIEKHSKEFTLDYDPESDRIKIPVDLESGLNTSQLYPLKNIQHEDVLSFPNLLRSFAILMSIVIQDYSPLKNLETVIEAMTNQLSYFKIVNEQSKQIEATLVEFLKQLKDESQMNDQSKLLNNTTIITLSSMPLKLKLDMTINENPQSQHFWDSFSKRLTFKSLTFPVKEVNGIKIGSPNPESKPVTIKITKPVEEEVKFKKPSFISNLEETKMNMDLMNRTTKFDSSRTSIFNSTSRSKSSFNEQQYFIKTLTSSKKHGREQLNRTPKKWMSLFNETAEISALEKTQSSINLCPPSLTKAADYSSFLSGLETLPDSTKGESSNEDASKMLKTPDMTPANNKSGRKSVDRIINTYKKFKETRLKDVNVSKIVENVPEKKSFSQDSFMNDLQISSNGQ